MENESDVYYTKDGIKPFYRWTFFLLILGTILLSLVYILSQKVKNKEMTPTLTQTISPLQKTVQLATIELIELSLAYNISTDSQKRILLPKLTDLANKRKTSMLMLMNIYPDIAVKITYPSHSRGLLPPQVEQLIEKEQTVKGTFEILHRDTLLPDGVETATASGVPFDQFFLTLSSDQHLNLVFVDEEASLKRLSPQTQVELTGIQLDDVFVINIDGYNAPQASNSVKGISQQKTLAATTKKLAVILVHPKGAPNFPDKALIENTLFNGSKSLNSLFRESSQNAFSWTGQIFGPYESLQDSSTCNNRNAWLKDADDGLKRDGINLIGYTKLYMWEPYITDCPFGGGYAFPGGNAYINGAWSFGDDWVIKIAAHELGHTFGFAHARWTNSPCYSQAEYGDCYDPMGIGLHHYHALHQSQLGWIATKDITTSGTYTLHSLSSTTTGVKNLRVKKNNNSAYYIEYRNNAGIFEQFGIDQVTSGMSIRLGSLMFDVPVFQYTDVVEAGTTSFSDPSIGLSLAVKNKTQNSIDIDIKLPTNALCVRVNPEVTISPSGQFGKAGDSLSYTLTVTNSDSPSCPATQFSLTSILPQELVQNPASSTITLAPEETKTITLQVTSSPALQPGFYSLTENIINSSDSMYKKTVSANYNIEPSNPPRVTPSQVITPTGTSALILTNIDINASSILRRQTIVGDEYPLSAMAYDQNSHPIWNNVSYEWGISSNNSIGRIGVIDSNVSSFKALNPGFGDVFVTARFNNNSLTKSIPVTVVSPTPVLSQTPLKADVNQDGVVDIFDYNIVVSTFGDSLDLRADFNENGYIDIFDYNKLIENFGTGTRIQP